MRLGNTTGLGLVVLRNKKPSYKGTMPSGAQKGEAIITIKKSDIELILANHQILLIQTKVPMKKAFYDLGNMDAERIFPDEIKVPDGKKFARLFLDRHWYSLDPSKYVWVRYYTIGASLSEGEINGQR